MTWNIRGLNAPNKWRLIKRQIDEAKGDIWVLKETKRNKSKIDMQMRVWRQWTRKFVEVDGASGGIGIIWNPLVVKGEVVDEGKHWQQCKITLLSNNESFFIYNIYGPTATPEKRELWNLISSKLDGCNRVKSIISWDFNATFNDQEKAGGIQRPSVTQRDFQNYIDRNSLIDIVPKNGVFT
ncbi:uncharacterized protein LOC131051743 [Cryptomeria japonica]|uniref:uncharacterized protein LOC131051743 n=1 Tax=Cryptomeria japonica TaxID=3369 RepID=UPI0027DA006F|nr:uncharacterized protein LOC131051743 [Cryptomeria japonica]